MRPMDGAVSAASVAPVIHPIVLIELDFLPDPLWLWTGLGDFAWDNKTFTGAGTLLGVGAIEETTETAAVGVALSLSGMPQYLIDRLGTVNWQGRRGRIWFGALTEAGALVGEPVQVLGGRMDVLAYQEGADDVTFSLTVENRLADLQRARVRRYTDRDQQDEYPGDTGFRYVAALQDDTVTWGRG